MNDVSGAQSPLRLLIFWAILALIIAGMIEGLAAATYHLVVLRKAHYLTWDPADAQVRQAWLTKTGEADEEVGWPERGVPHPELDQTGAKLNKDFPDPVTACVSAYGDSFIWGYDIPHDDGWIEQLSRRLGCRVSNFGIAGYGVDQAFLRFRQKTLDAAPVVLLGIYPQDVMRNVNQYRGFLGFPPHPFALKGRFILDGGGTLQWIPRPQLDLDRFVLLNRVPKDVIPHEYLLPDTENGPVARRFSYTWTLVSLLTSRRMRNRLEGNASFSDFLSEAHPSGAFPLTVAIVDAFNALAQQRGKRLLVLMLPGGSSLRQKENSGSFEYAALLERIRERSLDTFDVGEAMLSERGGRSYCELFTDATACNGHYSARGGQVISEIVAKELVRRGLARSVN